MSVLDIDYQAHRSPVSDWVFAHGAALAVIGCAAFWSVVGAALYLIL